MARPQKQETEKLTVILPVRLAPSDRERYKKLAMSKGLSVSDYIRQLVEHDAAFPSRKTGMAHNDNRLETSHGSLDERLVNELHRIGNNLNQLTKKYHSKGVEPQGLRPLFPVLEKLINHIFNRINIE